MQARIRMLPVFLLCCLSASTYGLAKQETNGLLPDGFPELTHSERDLAAVPGINSAHAVVLLEARQQTWEGAFSRVHYYYRVKILTEDGVEEFGSYTYALYGDWRVQKAEARTILPEGKIIDADDGVFQDASDDGINEVRVAWPRVEVGAILDLHLRLTADYVSIPVWVVQKYIPVAESRFVLVPPTGMSYSASVQGLPEESRRAKVLRSGLGKTHVWTFTNVPALPEEPNQPAVMNIAKKLFVIPTDIKDPITSAKIPLARDWKSYSYYGREAWERWIKEGAAKTRALAKQVAADRSTSTEKAEAIRLALHDKVQAEYVSDGSFHDSPDEVLSMGTGTSGEVAAMALVMLQEVGVDAVLASSC